MQAKLTAILRDLKEYPLNVVAWASDWGAIKSVKTGEPLKWQPDRQILPLESGLKKALFSSKYNKYVKEKSKEYNYFIDMEEFNKNKRSVE